MGALKSYVVRVGSLELGVVIFWMLFWLANGLGKVIPGVPYRREIRRKGRQPLHRHLGQDGLGHESRRICLVLHGGL